jgi:UDP-N-acetylmuramyl pentapeptide phosphotransferase/UDP-N-acetylglucosamine-1-phosphate transferase
VAEMWSFNFHRGWEDWFGIALGVLIGLSPWLAGQADNQVTMWITIAIGIWVVQFAVLQLVDLERSEEAGLIVCGGLLIVAPFALGYTDAGTLMYWHFLLGTIVVLLAVLELWQDWKLSDKELAQHGK